MDDELLPCPYCHRQPHVHHGVHGDLYGDSIECDRDDCPQPDNDGPVWHYTSWGEAVRRWNEFAANVLATTRS